jgi:hypothetical protein
LFRPYRLGSVDASQTSEVPREALLASLGCGNPTALAKLNAGETVLDLGSGGGIDVLLSAKGIALNIHPNPTLSETVMEAAEVFFGSATDLYRPKK